MPGARVILWALPGVSTALYCLSQFFQMRGYVNVIASRLWLVGIVVGFGVPGWAWALNLRRGRFLIGSGLSVLLIVAVLLLDRATLSKATPPAQSSSLPSSSIPNNDTEKRIEGKVDEIKKQLESKSPPASNEAFSIRTEFEMSSFGNPGRFTGFFVGYKMVTGRYVLVPVTHLVYVRITNLLSVRTIIQRLQVSLDGCDSKDMVNNMLGEEVFTTNFGSVGIGTPIIFGNGGTARSMVMTEIKSVDLSRATQLNLPFLERVLSDHYLEPRESVGGWLMFSSRCPGIAEDFTVEDVAGRTFKYRATVGSNEMKRDDLSRTRTMTPVRRVDLSGASVKEIQ